MMGVGVGVIPTFQEYSRDWMERERERIKRPDDIECVMEPLPAFRVMKTWGSNSGSHTRSVLREQTKTGVDRAVPLHPDFQRMLEHYRRRYQRLWGSRPEGPALLMPRRMTKGPLKGQVVPRSNGTSLDQQKRDFRRLGIGGETLRAHDWRKTMATLLERSGARRESIRRITHTSRADVLDGYIEKDYLDLCEAITKLRLPWPEGWAFD